MADKIYEMKDESKALMQAALENKAGELTTVLSENKIAVIHDATRHLVAQYRARSKTFITKYILNPVEYPTIESKLVQALTELQVRLDNLATRAYDYQKLLLDIEESELRIERLENNAAADVKEQDIKLRRENLELKNMKYRMGFVKHTAEEVYQEFLNWKNVVEDCLKALGKTSVDEIDFKDVKDIELQTKAQIWAELVKKGFKTDWKPTEIPIVLDNLDKINAILRRPEPDGFVSPVPEKKYNE